LPAVATTQTQTVVHTGPSCEAPGASDTDPGDPGAFSWRLNGTRGNAVVSAPPVMGSGRNSITKMVVEDVDGDGRHDIVGTGADGTLTAHFSKGTPTHPGFSAQPVICSGSDGINRIATMRQDYNRRRS
jgi:hypothetical protein